MCIGSQELHDTKGFLKSIAMFLVKFYEIEDRYCQMCHIHIAVMYEVESGIMVVIHGECICTAV